MLTTVVRDLSSSLVLALVVSGALGIPSARAQDVFGMLEAHNGMSAQAQYAANLHSQYSDGYDDDDSSRELPSTPNLTPEELAQLEADALEVRAQKEARYQRWLNGTWDFFQSREPAEPGEFCAALFQGPQGMITLSGFDHSWDGALLMFTGEDVPKPRSFREITATLTQTGEAPAVVRVYNYARDPRMNTLGTLVFAVPTMEAALLGVTDEQEFTISIEGRQVFRMAWKDGLSAVQELRKCLRKR